ncbi:MAG: beta(1,3)galactosyltransferase EpsH [Clostridia bacterium]|nr:beta(1,3)galactosyltransferase EpsH [Clostridia bacterium]
MIFITLGSQKFPFNRLLRAVDEQVEAGRITGPIFAQIGASDYLPKHFEWQRYLSREEFATQMEKVDLVITHGGTGAIVGALKKGKKVIAVPRLAKYGEHVDDHQLQLIAQFKELNLICECSDCGDLWKLVPQTMTTVFASYESNTAAIIESIEQFVSD